MATRPHLVALNSIETKSPTVSSSSWIWQGVKADETRATQAAYDRYAQRLLALVERRISASLQRRIDPEDILQSAYHSLFRGIREGRFHSHRQFLAPARAVGGEQATPTD